MTREYLLATIFSVVLFGVPTIKANDPGTALQTIQIPSIELSEVPLEQVLEFLQVRSGELSGSTLKSVNFILQGDDELRNLPISLYLSDVSLGQVLWFIGEIGRLRFDVDRHAVIVSKPAEWKRDPVETAAADQAVLKDINSIILPRFELEEVPLSDAVQLLRDVSKEQHPQKLGINLVLVPDPDKDAEAEVTLRLSRIPLAEAIRYTAQLASYEASIENGAVIIAPKPEPKPKEQPAPTF